MRSCLLPGGVSGVAFLQTQLSKSSLSVISMGGTRIFELGGQRGGKSEGIGGKRKLLLSDFQLRKTSSRCFGRLTTGNKNKFSIDCAVF